MLSSNTSATSDSATYVEDVFSTYLWTGTGATLSIVNNIDLATKGGLTWIKQRGQASAHALFDTARGATNRLATNGTNAQATVSGVTAFNTNGFTSGTDAETNGSGNTYVGWTFRKQPKFFDVVTYTGNGTTQNIAHSLGGTVGCVIVKDTGAAGAWHTWHRGLTSGNRIVLNTTAAQTSSAIANVFGNNTSYVAPTSTQFTVGDEGAVNTSGRTYVAYIFAHDAGGFGLTGTDNVISCGTFTGLTAGVEVTLGYEAQFVMVKRTDTSGNWTVWDTMRGMTVVGNGKSVRPNTSEAEGATNVIIHPTATGFKIPDATSDVNITGGTYIYIAIRRGPMKVPTDATKVFSPVAQNTGANAVVTTGFPVDLSISDYRAGGGGAYWMNRLQGTTTTSSRSLNSASTGAEYVQASYGIGLDSNTTIIDNFNVNVVGAGAYAYWNFKRAPSFFDEVCYTGTGAAQTLTHNLAAVPELMISRRRDAVAGWAVYSATLGATKYMRLQTDDAPSTGTTLWNDTAPTSTQFTLGSTQSASGGTYVQYLFATCAGVSKVGSYTGTGTTKQVDCGFAAGARFVLIKRTDSTGDWYVWDTARGIVSGNDPYLLLNSTAAEVTSTDYIDTYAAGFELSSTAPAALNASGGTYIFLAIA